MGGTEKVVRRTKSIGERRGAMNPLAPLAVFYWITSLRSNDHRNSSEPD